MKSLVLGKSKKVKTIDPGTTGIEYKLPLVELKSAFRPYNNNSIIVRPVDKGFRIDNVLIEVSYLSRNFTAFNSSLQVSLAKISVADGATKVRGSIIFKVTPNLLIKSVKSILMDKEVKAFLDSCGLSSQLIQIGAEKGFEQNTLRAVTL